MPAKHSYPTMEPLAYLLQMIHNRDMALPDFQRDFVWDPAMTDELIESLVNNFPAGTLLRVKNGQELLFQPRAFEGAPSLDGGRPAYLILDGQQRLTSLYQAFYGVGAHAFFLNLGSLEAGQDLEDAAFYDRSDKIAKGLARIEEQAQNLIFPMGRLFGSGGFNAWVNEVLRARGGSAEEVLDLQKRLADLRQRWLKPVEDYDFPMVTLAEDTPGAAVCTIFETLNRTGVKLGVFDLLTARFWPKSVNLRALWEKARADYQILDEFQIDPYYVLQIVNLLEPGADKDGHRKAASIKRGEILAQTAEQAQAGWVRAVRGLNSVLKILREDCGVAVPRWLPYTTMLIPAAAAWASQVDAAHAAQVGANRGKLIRWFWCASLGQRYENAPNTQAARDFVELRRWMIDDDAPPPESVAGFSFERGTLGTTTPRQRALYRAVMALILRNGPQDFHKRGKISTQLLSDPDNPVDDHHVFPQGYLNPRGVPPVLRDSILNRTLIDKITNIRIGKRAPSDYLSEIAAAWGSPTAVDELLNSHLLPSAESSPLLRDEFDVFLSWRESRLVREIESVTGFVVGSSAVSSGGTDSQSASNSATPEELGSLSPAITDLIEARASGWIRPLAGKFAVEASAIEGVELRVQQSKGDPWYFQVRHSRFPHVVAYVHPRQTELHIDYRLASDHDLYGLGQQQSGAYGIGLKVRQSADLGVAIRLLSDALMQDG
jgi:hypothetical protein